LKKVKKNWSSNSISNWNCKQSVLQKH